MAARRRVARFRSGDSSAGEFEFGGGTPASGAELGSSGLDQRGEGLLGFGLSCAVLRAGRGFARPVEDVARGRDSFVQVSWPLLLEQAVVIFIHAVLYATISATSTNCATIDVIHSRAEHSY
ncbi:hypothetical protein E2562_031176 [Oryza meyeriana var. granulata]|uniref:Uncharacterized protein n=1 Tax=Oryza meyeriana var. granulata TaxID=110450 RepID=A0A6G1EAZ6_9ORYZ|nr:hypothetical protein E2562_031176 [Oryza meyeriana var. granulata]